MRISVPAFAITCGLIWGLGLLLMTWWIVLLDGASSGPTFIGRVYRGYHLSYAGGLIGLAWALPDGAIGGAIFAWLYNRLADVFSRQTSASPAAA